MSERGERMAIVETGYRNDGVVAPTFTRKAMTIRTAAENIIKAETKLRHYVLLAMLPAFIYCGHLAVIQIQRGVNAASASWREWKAEQIESYLADEIEAMEITFDTDKNGRAIATAARGLTLDQAKRALVFQNSELLTCNGTLQQIAQSMVRE